MAYAYNTNIKHVANSLDTVSEIKTRLYKKCHLQAYIDT